VAITACCEQGNNGGKCSMDAKNKDGTNVCSSSKDCIATCPGGLRQYTENHQAGRYADFETAMRTKAQEMCGEPRADTCSKILLGAVDIETKSSATATFVCEKNQKNSKVK
jgi:hypothetical protein